MAKSAKQTKAPKRQLVRGPGPRQPPTYKKDRVDVEVFRKILTRMSNGEAATTICREADQPTFDVFNAWIISSPDLFSEYARAKQVQADFYAEEIVDIADTDGNVARARNRMDARRWHASKIAPRKYGDRIMSEVNQTLNTNIKLDLSNMTQEARNELKQALLKNMAPQIDGSVNK